MNDHFYNQDADTLAVIYDQQTDQWAAELLAEQQKAGRWQPMSTAPKTGIVIEVSYDESGTKPSEICLASWSERPVCMGGPTVYNKPGWATAGDNVDKNLPLDEPVLWRFEDE